MGGNFCNFLFGVCYSLSCVAQKTLVFEPVHNFPILLVSHATESYHKGTKEKVSDNMSTNSYLHFSWEKACLVGYVKHIGHIVSFFFDRYLAEGVLCQNLTCGSDPCMMLGR